MTRNSTLHLAPCRRTLAILVGLALTGAPPLLGQTGTGEATNGPATVNGNATIHACYIPSAGLLYLIGLPETPAECHDSKKETHIPFSWTDGVPGHDHGALNGLDGDDHLQYLLVDPSTRALVADLDAAGYRIVGLAAATEAGQAVRYEQAVKVDDGAGGDLGGTYPDPVVLKLQGRPVSSDAPADGQVLAWDAGTDAWVPVTLDEALTSTSHSSLGGLDQDDHPQYLLADGTRALSGDLSAGGNRITGLAAAGAAGDAVRWEQAVKDGDAAAGDLAGSYPDPTVAALQGTGVSSDAPSSGDVLTYDGSDWAPAAPASGITDHGGLDGLTDDDHEQYLLTDGVRNATDGFAVTGAVGTGSLPATGGGTRLMWVPGKAAFRAGRVTGTEWDDIGSYSTAFGWNTLATGGASVAIGIGSSATGVSAVALGAANEAIGNRSTALGDRTEASGHEATSMGSRTRATGEISTALGLLTEASGNVATATGWGTAASGDAATAMGYETAASGTGATATGFGTTASGDNATAIGRVSRASGFVSTAVGLETEASRHYAIAMGQYTTADGVNSTVLGRRASAGGHKGTFVYGDASTENTVDATADNQFYVRASGGVFFRTNAALTAGCILNPGAGAWSCTSSRDAKEDFQDLDGEEVLQRIAGMPIQEWSYITQPGVRHVGPTAQDFRAAFGLGTSDEMISLVDADGINMLAIQALERRTRTLEARVAALEGLRAEHEALRADHEALLERVRRLEVGRTSHADPGR